ncbi:MULTISPECIES: hypothetical protein [Bacillus]|uniref:hypothetical protein n=1 Tax=Bacillus TaxID=1386 RepID=UPI0002FB355D|nr:MULTISPECIES: hypothetical protein [Bacillus]
MESSIHLEYFLRSIILFVLESNVGGILLLIKECKGYELEKEKTNSPEDNFTRSEVIYMENGQEKKLHVLYVRFFEESFEQYVPYTSNPLFKVGERDIYFKDIVALVCLLHNPSNYQRKRIFISSQLEFAKYFKDIDFEKVELLVKQTVD